jgi:hypothetical protein
LFAVGAVFSFGFALDVIEGAAFALAAFPSSAGNRCGVLAPPIESSTAAEFCSRHGKHAIAIATPTFQRR